MTPEHAALVAQSRKAATAVYFATDETVAKELSGLLAQNAEAVVRLSSEVARLTQERDEARQPRRDPRLASAIRAVMEREAHDLSPSVLDALEVWADILDEDGIGFGDPGDWDPSLPSESEARNG